MDDGDVLEGAVVVPAGGVVSIAGTAEEGAPVFVASFFVVVGWDGGTSPPLACFELIQPILAT